MKNKWSERHGEIVVGRFCCEIESRLFSSEEEMDVTIVVIDKTVQVLCVSGFTLDLC